MDKQIRENKRSFSEKQKQELKKYAVFGLLFTLFLGVIWLIFKPSESPEEKGTGLNSEIPAPEKVEFVHKKNAYEQEYLKQKQNEKVKTLNNFALLALGDTLNKERKENNDIVEKRKISLQTSPQYEKNTLPAIQYSVDSYKRNNEAVNSFYRTSSGPESAEIKKLKAEIEKLKEEIQGEKTDKSRVEEQTELMEKSYQLAAKYFPQTSGQNFNPSEISHVSKEVKKPAEEKKNVVAVYELKDNTVSALCQNMSNQEFLEMFSQEKSRFYNTDDAFEENTKKGILVCIDHDQKIISEGQSICLRLLVPIQIGNVIIPKNYLIAGNANIRGERLQIKVNSIEFNKMILSVDLEAYALNGQPGIFVPDMIEVNVAKEIAGNMGGNLGTSISITHSAGEQVISDLGKSLIQGTSQYIQKKARAININLKSGHPLLLVTNKN